MRILFVINPFSGKDENEVYASDITAFMATQSHSFQIFETTGEEDELKLNSLIGEFKPQRVVGCGGDGTLQLVAKSIREKNITMGIIPLGSANGLATSLNIPKDFDESLRLAVEGPQERAMDLLLVNDHVCIHLADVGTNALLVKSYEEAGDKGMFGYAKHLLASIKQSELMHYSISMQQDVIEKEGYMLMIANANKYGTGVRISEGSISDGKFELCNVQKIDLESAIKAGLTALNVFVDKEMFSDVISCKVATIKIDHKAHLQIDGEYIGEVDTITVGILPAALSVIVNDE